VFQVKICGVTTAADARLAADAGADAIGLNFVAGSPRFLEAVTARAVAAAVPRGVLRVGVFAGATAKAIRQIAGTGGLDANQFHGHLQAEGDGIDQTGRRQPWDPPELCGQLEGLPVIRAVRLEAAMPSGAGGSSGPEADALAAARRWFAAAIAGGTGPAMALIDAGVSRGTAAGRLGGTGETVDWQVLAATPPLPVPMALAGGLTADNVAAAILATGLGAVDTASGVESAPGRKDAEKVRAFVAAARRALGCG